MNSFIGKFREEVNDYVEKLESGLLILEREPDNEQVIGEIFRLMHSMKGSGGMFGFNLLSEVMHDMESLYDLFRSGKCLIDPEVIGFTLKAIDGFSHLMALKPKTEDLRFAEQVKAEARLHLSRLIEAGGGTNEATSGEKKSATLLRQNESTYFISFIPDENLLQNGTNPLYLIDELNALGECNIQVSFERLPELENIDPEKCYISWYLFISTEESIDTLNDVFIFVTGSAEISIEKVSSGNVLANESLLAGFLNAWENSEIWNPEKQETQSADKKEIFSDLPDGSKANVAEFGDQNTAEKGVAAPAKVDSIKVDSHKIDRYMNLISELIIAQSRLEEFAAKSKSPEMESLAETFGKIGRQLRENAFDMSLIPLNSIVLRLERLIHDLSRSLDKEVVLVTEGMETELDKSIIEKLLEPLLHIIRNSMDHGIESRSERQRKNKKLTGTIAVRAFTIGSHVQIDVEDDGVGIDDKRVQKKAIERGVVGENEPMTDSEIYNLLFEPGFSTSEVVTDVSGRGVGLNVVRKRIQEMRGTIEINSEKDRFTRFTIKLPLSLSIIDGLLTSVGDGFYVIPSSSVRKIVSVDSQDLARLEKELTIDEIQMPFVNLHTAFIPEIPLSTEQFVVAVANENQTFGLVVDDVVREYQAVVKPLGSLIKEMEVFSGASILGTGDLALVVDTNKIIEKYMQA